METQLKTFHLAQPWKSMVTSASSSTKRCNFNSYRLAEQPQLTNHFQAAKNPQIDITEKQKL